MDYRAPFSKVQERRLSYASRPDLRDRGKLSLETEMRAFHPEDTLAPKNSGVSS